MGAALCSVGRDGSGNCSVEAPTPSTGRPVWQRVFVDVRAGESATVAPLVRNGRMRPKFAHATALHAGRRCLRHLQAEARRVPREHAVLGRRRDGGRGPGARRSGEGLRSSHRSRSLGLEGAPSDRLVAARNCRRPAVRQRADGRVQCAPCPQRRTAVAVPDRQRHPRQSGKLQRRRPSVRRGAERLGRLDEGVRPAALRCLARQRARRVRAAVATAQPSSTPSSAASRCTCARSSTSSC